jgi:polysaccharide export outer membrane protein
MSRFSLFLLGTLALSAGCSAHLIAAPTRPAEDAGFTVEAIPEPPGMEPAPAAPFRLEPGDVLSLRTISPAPLEVPRLSVDDAGFLHAPLTGAIAVAGVSLEEAEALLQERLRRYDRFGIVSLAVADPAGHRASALGAVARPGTYTLGSPTRVADLLAVAGGVQRADGGAESVELGDLEAARLIRAGEPLPISIPRALAGDPRHNVPLAPRDVLFVPALQGAAVRVLGEVKSARLVPWRPGLRLSEALAQAQGTSADADEADVRVVRGPLSAPRLYRASLRALSQGQATDVELARGDVVFVTKHWFASATDVLHRLLPLMVVSPVPR